MKSFDIDKFKSETQSGFMRPAFFLAVIAKPAWSKKDSSFLTFLCNATSLPGSQILTYESKIFGYGKQRKVPYGAASGDIPMTFYSDGKGETVYFFENWLRSIVPYGDTTKQYANKAVAGDVQYPSWYQTTIDLYQFNDKTDSEILKYTLYNAFPTTISDTSVSWDQGDAISTVTTNFAFSDYTVIKGGTAAGGLGGVSTILGALTSAVSDGISSVSSLLSTMEATTSTLTSQLTSVTSLSSAISSPLPTISFG